MSSRAGNTHSKSAPTQSTDPGEHVKHTVEHCTWTNAARKAPQARTSLGACGPTNVARAASQGAHKRDKGMRADRVRHMYTPKISGGLSLNPLNLWSNYIVLRYHMHLSRTDAAPGIADTDAFLHFTDASTVASYRARHES